MELFPPIGFECPASGQLKSPDGGHYQSHFAVLFAGISIAIGLAGCRQLPVSPASGALRGANLLLITIDTLRADHVGAYGNRLGLTPTLDRLASEGLRFERTY